MPWRERRDDPICDSVACLVRSVGSSNVCIYRLPRERVCGLARLALPACRQPVAVYDNIPIVSYLASAGGAVPARCPFPPNIRWWKLSTAIGYVL